MRQIVASQSSSVCQIYGKPNFLMGGPTWGKPQYGEPICYSVSQIPGKQKCYNPTCGNATVLRLTKVWQANSFSALRIMASQSVTLSAKVWRANLSLCLPKYGEPICHSASQSIGSQRIIFKHRVVIQRGGNLTCDHANVSSATTEGPSKGWQSNV